jgi:N-acyl-phosphatidylethanolamine-hydrolysing phospholipase D
VSAPAESPDGAYSPHQQDGGFHNPWGAGSNGQENRLGSFLKWVLIDRPRNRTGRSPDRQAFAGRFPLTAPSFARPRATPSALTITWVGHSSFLLQIGGCNLLTDPVWGDRASPVPWAGPRRWLPPGIDFDTLPPIDAVLISHNHYDHLDDATVRRLVRVRPAPRWFAPLGVGQWLSARGAQSVADLDWWSATEWASDQAPVPLQLTATPAQHFSGRGITDRNATLWCGWTVRTGGRAVWFVGDTGRHRVFDEIGRRLGPFDAVLMPIGAYDPRWFMSAIHVAPEEAVAGFGEAMAAAPSGGPDPLMVAMHWGTFKLTDEPMDQPPERTRHAWAAAGLPSDRLWIPRPGETRVL